MVSRRIWGYRAANRLIYTGYLSFCSCSSFIHLVLSPVKLADIASSEFDKQLKALTSIRGIGITLATALILTTGGFTFFDNAKQLSRFIGICPTYQQSGTSVNIKGHINRNGDEHLRSLLYVASWTALRYNAACRECYIRLKANGKPSKVALIAVANKPLRIKFYFF